MDGYIAASVVQINIGHHYVPRRRIQQTNQLMDIVTLVVQIITGFKPVFIRTKQLDGGFNTTCTCEEVP